jgi:hypothetical protein
MKMSQLNSIEDKAKRVDEVLREVSSFNSNYF